MYQPKVISCRPDSDVVGKIPPLVNIGLEHDPFVDDLLYIHTYDKRWFSDFPMANGGFPQQPVWITGGYLQSQLVVWTLRRYIAFHLLRQHTEHPRTR